MTGNQLAVYETMKNFINAKYYTTENDAVEILKAFQVTQDITPEQYTVLTLLNKQVYEPIVEVPPVTLEEPMIEETTTEGTITEEVPVVTKAKKSK